MPLVRKPDPNRAKSRIRHEGEQGMLRALRAVQKRHEEIVAPWRNSRDKPKFSSGVTRRLGRLEGTVLMTGQEAEQAHKTVWQLLEHGTRIRYMKLSPDWVSKTWPGQLSSGPGGGVKLGLDFEDPEGGIRARNWAEGVAEEQKTRTGHEVRDGWKKGFQAGIG